MHLVVLVVDCVEKCSALLEAWEKAGARGFTILESIGLGRLQAMMQDDLPLMPSLRDLLGTRRNITAPCSPSCRMKRRSMSCRGDGSLAGRPGPAQLGIPVRGAGQPGVACASRRSRLVTEAEEINVVSPQTACLTPETGERLLSQFAEAADGLYSAGLRFAELTLRCSCC